MADPALLDAVKRQLSLISTIDDPLLDSLIDAAIDHVERETGLILTRRTVIETVLPPRSWTVRAWPIVTIDSITYRTRDDVEQIVDPAACRVIGSRRPGTLRLTPAAARAAGCLALLVTMTAGYENDAAWPATVRQAVMILVAEFYANREAGAISDAAQRSLGWLLRPHKIRTL